MKSKNVVCAVFGELVKTYWLEVLDPRRPRKKSRGVLETWPEQSVFGIDEKLGLVTRRPASPLQSGWVELARDHRTMAAQGLGRALQDGAL